MTEKSLSGETLIAQWRKRADALPEDPAYDLDEITLRACADELAAHLHQKREHDDADTRGGKWGSQCADLPRRPNGDK